MFIILIRWHTEHIHFDKRSITGIGFEFVGSGYFSIGVDGKFQNDSKEYFKNKQYIKRRIETL